MVKIVLYTAIFGPYDRLCEPKTAPEGVDFVCFTDQNLTSKVWQIRKVAPQFEDPTRNARMYKILPHRYLGGYDVSIWIDGNMLVRGDVRKLAGKYLTRVNMAVYDHACAKHRDRAETPDSQKGLAEQLDALLTLAERGRMKGNPERMERQVEHYLKEGYPDNQGMLISTVLLRRHNDVTVRETMESWWREVKSWGTRDQLSFNYVAWKNGLKFSYIEKNVRNNKYFLHNPHKHHLKWWQKLFA